MNVACNSCAALHWIDERIPQPGDPQFEACCKHGDINLPLFQPPPEYLRDLLESTTTSARQFRERLRSYNAALAFTSVNCTVTDRGVARGGPNCFQIHGELYHLQGPLEPPTDVAPRYAQLYFYDPSYATDVRLRARPDTQLDATILRCLTAMLSEVRNPFIALYQTARERLQVQPTTTPSRIILNPQMRLILEAGADRRRENLPTSNEVAVIIPDEYGDASFRDIVLADRCAPNEQPRYSRINSTHAAYMPLHYVLLFPRGDTGWHWGLQLRNSNQARQRDRLSQRAYFRFYLHVRNDSKLVPFAYYRLFQQYVVDAWALCDQNKLTWIRSNQTTLRAELYNGVADALTRADLDPTSLGRRVVLPSSFLGGARFIGQCYQDSMAIVRKYSRPSLFITFTANPKWDEITRELLPGQTATDRPDLVVRVFRIKVTHLLHDLKRKQIFGRYLGSVYTIEYQKRGLPHMHLLLFLHPHDRDRLLDPAVIDRFISAELPQPEDDPTGSLTEIVKSMMVHGPCGSSNPRAPCMVAPAPGLPPTCSKRYPKRFNPTTVVREDGYPEYRRRNDLRTWTVRLPGGAPFEMDNRWIIPYNPYLSAKYRAHINVEVCASVRSVKYIHKYIYKGNDRTTLRLTDGDEVSQYLQGRYIGPSEAIWRLFEFPVHEEFPPVIQLAVHLPGEQPVYFQPDQSVEEIQQRLNLSCSTLTAFFKYNTEHDDDDARNRLYQDFPERYVFLAKQREWRLRQRGRAIGRMYYCSPVAGERFYLRLLLTSVPGPTSFKDLRTIAGTVYPTFQAACVALGLLEDDREWIDCFTEAAVFAVGAQLRSLFATALLYGPVAEPVILWDRFKQSICDDLPRFLARQPNVPPTAAAADDAYLDYGLYLIHRILADQQKTLADYGLPQFQHQWGILAEGTNPLLAAELQQYDPIEEERQFTDLRQQLNADQAACFNTIIAAIDTDPQTARFFLQGPAGTGKTFLYRCLCHYYRSRGKIVLCVASSGIAALLLPGGRTAHSRFRIPIDLHEESTCNVSKNSNLAELLRRTSLLIWDEVPMQHRYCFEAVHRMLTDVRSNDSTFGGLPTILGGDFAQILPVVPRGDRAAVVGACLQRSFLWPTFRILSLRLNMRVRHGEANQQFAAWVRSLSCNTSLSGSVAIPAGIAQFRSAEPFYGHIYPPQLLAQAHTTPDTFRDRAILTIRNDTVAKINEAILTQLYGSLSTFYSINSIE